MDVLIMSDTWIIPRPKKLYHLSKYDMYKKKKASAKSSADDEDDDDNVLFHAWARYSKVKKKRMSVAGVFVPEKETTPDSGYDSAGFLYSFVMFAVRLTYQIVRNQLVACD